MTSLSVDLPLKGVPVPYTVYHLYMKETPRRKITVMSSFNEISTDQLGNRVVVREGGVTPPVPTPFYSSLVDRYLKTT